MNEMYNPNNERRIAPTSDAEMLAMYTRKGRAITESFRINKELPYGPSRTEERK